MSGNRRCPVEMWMGKQCGRESYDKEGLCIFHSRIEKKDPERFEKLFWEEFERMNEDPKSEALDFTMFIFPTYVDFEGREFKKPAIYRRCQFSKIVYFGRAKFLEAADFRDSKFSKGAGFGGAKFSKMTSFERSKFLELADFYGAVFSGSASFSYAKFSKVANFMDAKFTREVAFSHATFSGSADFLNGKFSGEARFNGVWFKGCGLFNNATFSASVDFSHAGFSEGARFIDVDFGELGTLDFTFVGIHEPGVVEFVGLRRRMDLSRAMFLHTDVRRMRFLNEEWAKREGRNEVYDEEIVQSHGKEGEANYAAVAELYRRLRRNYEANLRYPEAGDFYVGEMEMRRLDVKIKNGVLRWLRQNVFSLTALYKHLSLYGESYRRAGAWILGSIVFFALLNLVYPPRCFSVIPKVAREVLVNSVFAFFQLRGVTALDNIERLWGVLILTLFALALRRRFRR